MKKFVALRFVAVGEANVRHLRKDGEEIHRSLGDMVDAAAPTGGFE